MTNQDNDSTQGARITMIGPAAPDHRVRVPTRTTLVLDIALLFTVGMATSYMAVRAIFQWDAVIGFLLGLVAVTCLTSRLFRQQQMYQEAMRQMWFMKQPTTEPSAMWHDPRGDLILVYPGHWPNRQELARMLSRLEEDGYIPNDDEVTRALRVELGLS